MSGKWAGLLKNSKHLHTFDADLREHLSTLFELEEELVEFVLSTVPEVHDQKQLAAEFAESFEEDAADVAAWCWKRLTQLSQKTQHPAVSGAGHADGAEAAGLHDEGSEEGEITDEQPHEAVQEERQPSKTSKKREPIKFNLDNTAADTAPIKASSHKLQQLRPHRAADDAAIASFQPQRKEQQQQQQQQWDHARGRVSEARAPRGPAAVVQGALQAAARSAAAADSKGSKDSPTRAGIAAAGPRGRGRQREQMPPAQAPAEKGAVSSGRQERQPGTISRAAQQHRQPAARLAGAKRGLAVTTAGPGARGIASRALQQIGAIAAGGRTSSAAKRQQQEPGQEKPRQEQQQDQQWQDQRLEAANQQEQPDVQQQLQQQQPRQQRSSRVSVLARLGSRDSPDGTQKTSGKHSVFERLSGLAPEAGASQAAGTEHQQAAASPSPPAAEGQAKAAKQDQPAVVPDLRQERQPRQKQPLDAVETKVQRKSISSRLDGAGSGPLDAQQQQLLLEQQERRKQQPAQPSGAEAAVAAVQQVQQTPSAALGTKRKASPGAAAGINGSTSAAASGGAAKKAATAAAAGAKPQQSSELAALRAKLAAKEAEVKRLQQLKTMQAEQQQADERSVVVFNVAPHVPETVVRAHFGGCGPIKRCTVRSVKPGPSVPGAYIEFETTMGALAAMGLAGSILLDHQIQVARKSDYQANQQKAQQTFAALRAQAARNSWVKPVAAAAPTAVAGAAGTGEPESPTSLGSMGLLE